MKIGVNLNSEVGKLNKVLLHRPGNEILALQPDNFNQMLFVDIPNLEIMQKNHDLYAKAYRDCGVEVLYYRDETAKALEDKNIREQFVNEFVGASGEIAFAEKEKIVEYLTSLSTLDLVDKVIAGVKKSDLGTFELGSLEKKDHGANQYFLQPMPNMYFTRDSIACAGRGLSINHTYSVRRRESLLAKYIALYNRTFLENNENIWYEYEMPFGIEGGDMFVLDKETVLIGLTGRTTSYAIELYTKKLLQNSDFKQVIVFDIPNLPRFLHLDTAFSAVSFDTYTVYDKLEDITQIYKLTLDSNNQLVCKHIQDTIKGTLEKQLKIGSINMISVGGEDKYSKESEQWNFGTNHVAVAPGELVIYDRCPKTCETLLKNNIKLHIVPSAELSGGHGGPRCMSCPVSREG